MITQLRFNTPGLIWVAAIALLLTAGTTFAADYYVSTSGNDGNSGSSSSPWRTLQKAAGSAGPGDVVHVLDGSYAGMNITGDGNSSSPITFQADGSNVRITSRNPVTDEEHRILTVLPDGWVFYEAEVGSGAVKGTGAIKFDYSQRHSSLGYYAWDNNGMAQTYKEFRQQQG